MKSADFETVSNSVLVTVAMVTYNSSKYVSVAIESVLSSSYANFELIISDDNSSDDTWNIIQSFKDKRIRAFKNEKNIGEYPNRNRCIELASGEYLIFIDGDDMIYPHGLEFMTKMLNNFPDCGMALMRWYKKNIVYPVIISPRQLFQGVYFDYGFNDMAFANTFFRLSFLRKAGMFPENIKAGDNYIRLKVGGFSNTLLISDQLTFWRETPGQASSSIFNTIEGVLEHFDQCYYFLKNAPLSEIELDLAKKNLRIKIFNVIKHYVKKRKLGAVIQLIKYYKISLKEINLIFSRPAYVDPFAEYSPTSPCMLPLTKNPFSR